MPRPNLKDQRTEEILDAFERCIPLYGIEGTSLERIAEEAGVKRTIIRHYIGNRDEVVDALSQRLLEKFYATTEELFAALPEKQRIEPLLDLLLGFEPTSDADGVLVFESLVAVAPRYPALQEKLRDWVEHFVDRLADEIGEAYADRSREDCWTVAYAITALYFNLDSLAPLALDVKYRQSSIDAAKRLLASLTPVSKQKRRAGTR